MDAVEQGFVVDQAEQQHEDQAAGNPIDLLYVHVHVSKPAGHGGAVDLRHPHGTDQKHKQEQHPVKISQGDEFLHCLPLPEENEPLGGNAE